MSTAQLSTAIAEAFSGLPDPCPHCHERHYFKCAAELLIDPANVALLSTLYGVAGRKLYDAEEARAEELRNAGLVYEFPSCAPYSVGMFWGLTREGRAEVEARR